MSATLQMLDMHRPGLLSRRHCPTRPWLFRCSFMQLPASITASSAGLVICAAMRATRTLSVAHVAAIAEGKGQVCALIAIQDPASPAPHSSVVCSALPAENPTPFHPSHVLPKTAQSANKQKKNSKKSRQLCITRSHMRVHSPCMHQLERPHLCFHILVAPDRR